jgi:hypothetical protein
MPVLSAISPDPYPDEAVTDIASPSLSTAEVCTVALDAHCDNNSPDLASSSTSAIGPVTFSVVSIL